MKLILLSAFLFLLGTMATAENSKVFFIEPKNNAIVSSTFKVKMGLKGMIVCEANIETKEKKCGHHHIIVDGKAVTAGQPVAKDETHIHYGKKQIETELTLSPGKHSLTLQFADYSHLSFGEKFSDTITVEVK